MVEAPERIWAYPSNVTGWKNPFCRTTPASQLVIEYIRADLATLSDAVAEREAEPVASVAEVRADGQRLYNTVYPSDALDKFPIGTLLYTSPPTSELEALRKRVAELEKAEDEAYRIIGKLEAYAINDVMYDGRDVAAWCADYAASRVREGGKVDG